MTRTRGIMLPIVTIPEEVLLEKLNAQLTHVEWEKGVRYTAAKHERLVYAVKGDQHWTIGTEGVGWEMNTGMQVEFDSVSWTDGVENHTALLGGNCIVEFGFEEALTLIREHAVETVDLADWVRTFGARLESNFDLWYGRLA